MVILILFTLCPDLVEIGKMSSRRRRPLHTCGVSVIKIAQRAYDVGQDLIEPLSSKSVKRMAKIASFATPFCQALLYFWLAVLALIDDQIILW